MFEKMSVIELIKLLAPIIAIQLFLIGFSLYSLKKDAVKYLPKWGWIFIIVFFNILGPIVYLLIGREGDKHDKDRESK